MAKTKQIQGGVSLAQRIARRIDEMVRQVTMAMDRRYMADWARAVEQHRLSNSLMTLTPAPIKFRGVQGRRHGRG